MRLRAGLLVFVLGGAVAHAQTLMTADQKALDQRFAKIFESSAFQAAMQQGEQQFRRSKLIAVPGAEQRIRADNAAVTVGALQLILGQDPYRPVFAWTPDAARNSGSSDIPFAGWAQNNPDNIYRSVAIDGASSYEIAGRRTGPAPAQTSFQLYQGIPGDLSAGVDRLIGGIFDNDLKIGADGTFTITVDAEPANGRPNHIQSTPGLHYLIVRETLADWAHEVPADLQVRRVKGPTAPPVLTDDQIVERALALAKSQNAAWLDDFSPKILSQPTNSVSPLQGRTGGWGYLASGHFRIADDEALVITIDPMGARYTGFQTADIWGIPFDYVHHTSSLTNGQAIANPDGTYTYIIAARDPAITNWLDTGGAHEGTFLLRWQSLPTGTAPNLAGAVRSAKVVTLAELASLLPTGTPSSNQQQREAQRAARAESWQRRLR